MSAILSGLPGVVCQMDDVLAFGEDQSQHDERLDAALRRLESAGVTINPGKCKFSCREIDFLGHIINDKGAQAKNKPSSKQKRSSQNRQFWHYTMLKERQRSQRMHHHMAWELFCYRRPAMAGNQ